MKDICLIGNGGHSKVIRQIAQECSKKIGVILDDKIKKKYFDNGIIYDNLSAIKSYVENYNLIIAIGNNNHRYLIQQSLKKYQVNYTNLISKSATVADDVTIGNGTVIMPGVIVNSSTSIGEHCILNTSCVVEHDNNIEDFVHISPNATLTGSVNIKRLSHVGAGAIIIPGITVAEKNIIGAGSVVIKDTSMEEKVVGVPARRIKNEIEE